MSNSGYYPGYIGYFPDTAFLLYDSMMKSGGPVPADQAPSRFSPMTIQGKTAAIQQPLAMHEDNRAAVVAAVVPEGLDALVNAARAKALTEKLVAIFVS
jgi:hypothetical protein